MSRFVVYVAVLPSYRAACLHLLRDQLGADLTLFASREHLDRTVRSGVARDQFIELPMVRFGKSTFFQLGGLRKATKAETTIVDLNPRSISAWLLLLIRRSLSRRTLVWGHLHPRNGPQARTAFLRRMMRRFASGTVTYTHAQGAAALEELHTQPVWIATNALYKANDMQEALRDALRTPVARDNIIYVGRLEPEKFVDRILPAFELHAQNHPQARLVIIGEGSMLRELQEQREELGLVDRVSFLGSITHVDQLAHHYKQAFCSLSPGFAGLGLTQSLGFGVPQIVTVAATHSPEIELASERDVFWTDSSDAEDFADAMGKAYAKRDLLPLQESVRLVVNEYSADSMAAGLANAFLRVGARDWKQSG